MPKDIKDFLHLYLNSIEVQCPKLSGWPESQKRAWFTRWFWFKNHEKNFIPILRPLSDMTEEERKALGVQGICYARGGEWTDTIDHALRTRYLLSKGFDLFGLIEAGQAIDKTKEVRHA